MFLRDIHKELCEKNNTKNKYEFENMKSGLKKINYGMIPIIEVKVARSLSAPITGNGSNYTKPDLDDTLAFDKVNINIKQYDFDFDLSLEIDFDDFAQMIENKPTAFSKYGHGEQTQTDNFTPNTYYGQTARSDNQGGGNKTYTPQEFGLDLRDRNHVSTPFTTERSSTRGEDIIRAMRGIGNQTPF